MIVAILLAALALPFYWKRPAIGFLINALLQALVFGASWEVSLTKVAYGVYFAICMVLWLPGGFATLKQTLTVPMSRWLIAMFVLFFVSRLVGAANGLSATDWFRDVSPLLNYGFIFLGVSAFRREHDVKRYLIWMTALLFVLSIPTAATWMWFRGLLAGSNPVVMVSSASPTVFMGGFFIAITLAIEAHGRYRYRYALVATYFLTCMVVTGSRTEFASAFLGCLVLAILYMRRGDVGLKRVVKLAGAGALAFVVLTIALVLTGKIEPAEVADRFLSATSEDILEDQTVTNRVSETLDALQAFSQTPVLGKGLGYQTGTTYQIGFTSFVGSFYFIHNMYAYVLAKFGVIGFIIVMGFFFSAIRGSTRAFFSAQPDIASGFYASFTCLTIALLIESLTANQFVDRTATSIYGILGGLLVFRLNNTQMANAMLRRQAGTA